MRVVVYAGCHGALVYLYVGHGAGVHTLGEIGRAWAAPAPSSTTPAAMVIAMVLRIGLSPRQAAATAFTVRRAALSSVRT